MTILGGRSLIIWRRSLAGALLKQTTPAARLASTTVAAATPTTPSSTPPHVSNPASRPYARHRPALPEPKSYKLPAALLILFSVGSWTAFTIHATNRERLSSSVLKNVMEMIKDDKRLQRRLGDNITLEREVLLAGDPWINGSINMMQGKVDMSFRVRGSKDSGKVYFTSIRRDQSNPFETLRFLLILDSSKETISLLDE